MEVRPLDLRFVCPSFRCLGLGTCEGFEVEVVDFGSHLSFNLHLGNSFGAALIASTFRFNFRTESTEGLGWHKLYNRAGVSKLAELLKVSSILVHWNLDDSAQDRKDLVVLVMRLHSVFEFQVLVPERMGKEVQSNTGGTAFK